MKLPRTLASQRAEVGTRRSPFGLPQSSPLAIASGGCLAAFDDFHRRAIASLTTFGHLTLSERFAGGAFTVQP